MARKCIVCGKEYHYCRSCPKDAKKETWYALYDNENCKNISQTLTDYDSNKITKEEAKDALSKCDLSIKLKEYYRNIFDVVMAKPKRAARQKVEIEVVEEHPVVIIEEQPIVEEIQPVIEEAKEEPIGVVLAE